MKLILLKGENEMKEQFVKVGDFLKGHKKEVGLAVGVIAAAVGIAVVLKLKGVDLFTPENPELIEQIAEAVNPA